jgi:hypothetical protein
MSDALPLGWARPALDEIVELNPRHPAGLDNTLPVTFVSMSGVSEDSWAFERTEERALGAVQKGYTHFAEGDVLFAKIMDGWNGRICQKPASNHNCIGPHSYPGDKIKGNRDWESWVDKS